MVKASIIIPTKQAGKKFDNVLKKWSEQKTDFNYEILIIDSGSTDNTLETAQKFNAKIVKIEPTTFSHGSTRNLAINFANGEILVFTVQDAIPLDNYVLAKLISRFDNRNVVAVTGNQIIPQNCKYNPLEWKSCGKNFYLKKIDISNFKHLSPKEKYQLSYWDNVLAAYRKEALTELPFENVIFGEDMIWAYNALKKGWQLGYDKNSCVIHYHHYTIKWLWQRTYIAFIHTYVIWNYKRKYPFIIKILAGVTLRLLKIKCKRKFFWLIYNYKYWLTKYASFLWYKLTLFFIKDQAKLKKILFNSDKKLFT